MQWDCIEFGICNIKIECSIAINIYVDNHIPFSRLT